ncbi:19964_t:CDS:2, partial [Racocetra persica]
TAKDYRAEPHVQTDLAEGTHNKGLATKDERKIKFAQSRRLAIHSSRICSFLWASPVRGAPTQLPRTKIHKITERPMLIINATKNETCPICVLKAYNIRRTDPKYTSGERILFIKADG